MDRVGTSVVDRPPETLVRAAGGMIVRQGPGDGIEVAVVHRPMRADWSFPKGKLEPGESFEECAIREVAEETGFGCRLGPFVGHTEYRDRKDRPKVVAYWVMEAVSGGFAPGREVDELRWVALKEASRLLSYERDRELLVALGAAAHDLFEAPRP
ncbi:MAG: NUDIX hydrolase [Actinomycetota bacterium]|nr:NUDIX hydrolase [Actinomycetota bacterium]